MRQSAKELMTVDELARRSGVAANTIRYYTRIGLLRPDRDPGNGYRLFEEADLRRLEFVNKAKQLGFSLSEIRKIIDTAEQGRSPCQFARATIERRIAETRRRIERLSVLQRNMECAVATWADIPDCAPGSTSFCHLIELAWTIEPPALAAD